MTAITLERVSPADSPASSLEVSLADLHRDAEELESLWSRSYITADPRRMQRYQENPAGPGQVLVLRTPEGELAGAIGLHRRAARVNGVRRTVGQVGNFAVDERFRSGAAAMQLLRSLTSSPLARECEFLFGVTARICGLLVRAGFRRLGVAERWSKPLRSRGYLERHLRSPLLARVFAPAVDFGLRITSRGFGRLPAGYSTDVRTTFSIGCDALWERAASKFCVACSRAQADLAWRFPPSSTFPTSVFELRDPCHELRGYIAYGSLDGCIEVSDFLADSPHAQRLVIAEFIRHVRRRHREALGINANCFGNPEATQLFSQFGFFRRTDADAILVRFNPALPGASAAPTLNPADWFLTDAELDV